VRAALAVPVLAQAFTADQREGGVTRTVTLFSPPPVGILLGAGLRMSIP
jgi:hypothetical protein